MTSSVLAALLARKPFRPFAFIVDGRRVHVSSPLLANKDLLLPIVTVTDLDGVEFIIDLERVTMIRVDPK